MAPLVSIVTICWKNPVDLDRTLSSFEGIDPALTEVIVVDGSPDDSCAKVVRISRCVTQYLHGPDDGKYDAMNKGIRAAYGQSVICINAGDRILDTNRFNRAVAALKDELPLKIVFFDVAFEISGHLFYVQAPEANETNLRTGTLPSHQATFVPAIFYARSLYDTDMLVAADTKLLRVAFRDLDHLHVKEAHTVFAHGGISGVSGTWSQELQHLHESYVVCDLSIPERMALLGRLVIRKLIVSLLGPTALEHWKYRNAARRYSAIGLPN